MPQDSKKKSVKKSFDYSRLTQSWLTDIKNKTHLDEYFFDKITVLSRVGRFLVFWSTFMVLLLSIMIFQFRDLASYYTYWQPTPGGIYTEGLVGVASNFNPIYAITEVDKAVVELVFGPLFSSTKGQFQLAQSLEKDNQAQQYILRLKPNLKWHDGQPLTANDVIFTIKSIQDPLVQSPLRDSWEGVSVDKIDDLTIIFNLPAGFAAFSDNLKLTILPQHLLGEIEPSQFFRMDFNYRPIGYGPFKFDRILSLNNQNFASRETIIKLRADPDHLNPPQLDEFHLWAVPNQERLLDLFNQGQLSGALGLDRHQIKLSEFEYRTARYKLQSGIFLFFKNSTPFLRDVRARQAIAQALDIPKLLSVLGEDPVRLYGPLLPSHLGYKQSSDFLELNLSQSKRLLRQMGWTEATDGWTKNHQKLKLTLTTQQNTDYALLAAEIKKQLKRLKIEVNLDLRSSQSLANDVLQNHDYSDLLIYGLDLGRDADVYSYWHSSQIGSKSVSRLNLAHYKSVAADKTLEIGRSRSNIDIRKENYWRFQDIWRADLPAIPLYQYQINHYVLKNVNIPDLKSDLVISTDRLANITDWTVAKTRRSF